MKFNENFSALRKQKGLSQEELAEQLGVSRQAISKWENGLTSPEMAHIENICRILETTPNRLLGYEEEVQAQNNEPPLTNTVCEEKPKRNWLKILVIFLICVFGLNLLAVVGSVILFSSVTSPNGKVSSFSANSQSRGELVSDFSIIAGDQSGDNRRITVEFIPNFTNEDYEYALVVIDDSGKEKVYRTESVGNSVCRAEIELKTGTYQTRLIARANKEGTKDYQSELFAVVLGVSENSLSWESLIS